MRSKGNLVSVLRRVDRRRLFAISSFVLLGGVAVVGLALRFHHLEADAPSWSYVYNTDEGHYSYTAHNRLALGHWFVNEAKYGLITPLFSFAQFAVAAIRGGEPSIVSYRLVSALCGVLSCGLMALFFRDNFRRLAVVALASVSFMGFVHSRLGITEMMLTLMAQITALAAWRAFARGGFSMGRAGWRGRHRRRHGEADRSVYCSRCHHRTIPLPPMAALFVAILAGVGGGDGAGWDPVGHSRRAAALELMVSYDESINLVWAWRHRIGFDGSGVLLGIPPVARLADDAVSLAIGYLLVRALMDTPMVEGKGRHDEFAYFPLDYAGSGDIGCLVISARPVADDAFPAGDMRRSEFSAAHAAARHGRGRVWRGDCRGGAVFLKCRGELVER